MGVTSGSEDLENTFLDGKERDIESTTSKIVDDDLGLGFAGAVKTVRDGGGSWLVDDSKNSQTSDRTSVLGGLSLSVVEV